MPVEFVPEPPQPILLLISEKHFSFESKVSKDRSCSTVGIENSLGAIPRKSLTAYQL